MTNRQAEESRLCNYALRKTVLIDINIAIAAKVLQQLQSDREDQEFKILANQFQRRHFYTQGHFTHRRYGATQNEALVHGFKTELL